MPIFSILFAEQKHQSKSKPVVTEKGVCSLAVLNKTKQTNKQSKNKNPKILLNQNTKILTMVHSHKPSRTIK
jgi:hypothetical protein